MTQTVLIVEDNELNMKLFHDLLEAYGIQTIQVNEGKKALDKIRENKPDLVIMDIQLPEISGLEITRQLKQDADLKHIPVIAVTAFAMKGDEQKIREGGCEDYISKPISVSRFIEVVKKHLDTDKPQKPKKEEDTIDKEDEVVVAKEKSEKTEKVEKPKQKKAKTTKSKSTKKKTDKKSVTKKGNK